MHVTFASVFVGSHCEYRYCLTVKDHWSRYCWIYPLLNKESSTVAEHVKQAFHDVGAPRIMQTDNGSEFIGEPFQTMLASFNVRWVHGRPRSRVR